MGSAPASDHTYAPPPSSSAPTASESASPLSSRRPQPSGPSSAPSYVADTVRTAAKILIVGHFAVGKTTYVGTLSEIRPLRTEETMTQAGAHVDDLAGVPDKTTTTVAMDFGRLTLSESLVLYLFGAPGQKRFTQLWKDMLNGALGALVLADTRRLDQSFDVMGLLEEHGMPYAVAVNEFDGAPPFPEGEIREALDLLPETPLVTCDARDAASSTTALIALVEYLQTRTAPGQAPDQVAHHVPDQAPDRVPHHVPDQAPDQEF